MQNLELFHLLCLWSASTVLLLPFLVLRLWWYECAIFGWAPKGSWALLVSLFLFFWLLFFQDVFSLLIRLGNLYFLLVHGFFPLCPLFYSRACPICQVFHFSYYVFNSKVLTWFFGPSVSLLRFSTFCLLQVFFCFSTVC